MNKLGDQRWIGEKSFSPELISTGRSLPGNHMPVSLSDLPEPNCCNFLVPGSAHKQCKEISLPVHQACLFCGRDITPPSLSIELNVWKVQECPCTIHCTELNAFAPQVGVGACTHPRDGHRRKAQQRGPTGMAASRIAAPCHSAPPSAAHLHAQGCDELQGEIHLI